MRDRGQESSTEEAKNQGSYPDRQKTTWSMESVSKKAEACQDGDLTIYLVRANSGNDKENT